MKVESLGQLIHSSVHYISVHYIYYWVLGNYLSFKHVYDILGRGGGGGSKLGGVYVSNGCVYILQINK